MKKSTRIFTCLTVLWMVCIFAFSSQNAASSTLISDKITRIVIDIIEPENKNDQTTGSQNNTDQNENSQTDIPRPQKEWFGIHRNNFRNFIRKIAHFILFFVLGVLSCCSGLCEFGKTKLKPSLKCAAISSVICVLYAVFDEIHQLFVQGRSANFSDILIDCAGSFAGILICIGLYSIFHTLRKNKKNNKVANSGI